MRLDSLDPSASLGISAAGSDAAKRLKFVEKLRYIHRNPVERGLVARPEDWAWSSFRHYLSGDLGACGDRIAVDRAEEGAGWNLSYGAGAATRRKSPPKRSLDGAPSRVDLHPQSIGHID